MEIAKKLPKKEDTLEDLMRRGVTGMLDGRVVTLGYYPGPHKRIGWVWKDTGLPASMENEDEH